MPTSPKRNEWSRNSVFSSTYPPTPPTQLPTPLPDEHLSVMQHASSEVVHSLTTAESEYDNSGPKLIDFDMSTPPPPPPILLDPEDFASQQFVHEDDGMGVIRTPPFREAQLPTDSPPPLPVRPRLSYPRLSNVFSNDLRDVHGHSLSDDMIYSTGHRRPPNLSRPMPRTTSTPISPSFSNPGASSAIENLTRTIRGYVPSIPSSGITATIAHPGTYFSNSPDSTMLRHSSHGHKGAVSERDYEIHDDGDNRDNDFTGRRHHPQASQDTHSVPATAGHEGRSTLAAGASGLAQAMQRGGPAHRQAQLTTDDAETISWARWDVLHGQLLLFLGYASGLQIWDCTRLSSVDEILNLNLDTEEWNIFFGRDQPTPAVVHAAVLPPASHLVNIQAPGGPGTTDRSLIGILLDDGSNDIHDRDVETTFLVYSVRHRHEVVKNLSFSGSPSTFVANDLFIVICTTNPATLYILSSTSFHTLHAISSSSFELFAPQVLLSNATHPSSEYNPNTKPVPPLFSTSFDGVIGSNTNAAFLKSPPPAPRPIFALSHRLLAYASSIPPSLNPQMGKAGRRLSSSSSASAPSGSSSSSSPFGFGLSGLGRITTMTQTDVGHAALKVSETVLSGMKFLGGIALEAAKNRVASASSSSSIVIARAVQDVDAVSADGRGKFVSRSAPDQHPTVHSSSTSQDDSQPHSTLPVTKPSVRTKYYVMVVDLLPLFLPSEKDGQSLPVKVDEFVASSSQPVAKIEFSADGTCIGVALRDGHSLKIFKLQPLTMSSISLRSDRDMASGEVLKTETTLVYNLRRGITSGIVERIEWAKDGRYVGICTRHGTVHIYAVNPYGGKADVRSHLEERVRNIETSEFPIDNSMPIARLKGSRVPLVHNRAALAFTFISSAELSNLPGLRPPLSPIPVPHSPTTSASGKRGSNYQHVLLFDPEDGVLSLHRLTLEKVVAREPVTANVAASAQALGVTSISLPGMGGAGKLSSSPATKGSHRTSGKPVEPEMELGAKTQLVATYHLKRGRNWTSVSKPMEAFEVKKGANSANQDFLAEAELSTCSNSDRVIPRSIYLTHQFSFHTLGEDYHALIRSYQFHIPGSKIEVRREVEVSAYPMKNTATFVDSFPSRDISSSIDEPIASAISGSVENSNIPPILPMYPNGIPGTSTKSLRNSIPVRAMTGIGEGVTESFGRIRREMHKVRSPHLSVRSDSASANESVPLEFDEEDEDFVNREINGLSLAGAGALRDEGSGSILSKFVAVPKLLEADVVGTVDEEMFDGWDVEDRRAVDEVEEFAHLSVAGFVEEDRQQREQIRR